MRSRNLVILSAVVAVLAVAIFGTVGFGIYAGLTAAHKPSPHGVVSGSAPEGVAGASGTTNTAAAPGGAALPVADSAANSSAIAQPAPGAFYPGMPPFGTGGAAADGISAWGVAYRQVSDPAAQPDAALIKAAYQDAEKKAADLAAATGIKLGKLVAMTDNSNNQPYYKPCIYPGGGPALGKPVPQGASGAGASAGAPTTTIAPAPCQANSNSYLVVWVYVRHAIG
ncbi:MAG: SIMPL domain-containing protein [Candidatus Dormibacteria bacterium]